MCAALPYPPPEGRFPNSTCMSIEGQRDRQVQHPFLEVLVECRRCLILTVSGRVLAELSRTRKLSQRLAAPRSEEHTSELQSRPHLVCRLLLEKKKKNNKRIILWRIKSTDARKATQKKDKTQFDAERAKYESILSTLRVMLWICATVALSR